MSSEKVVELIVETTNPSKSSSRQLQQPSNASELLDETLKNEDEESSSNNKSISSSSKSSCACFDEISSSHSSFYKNLINFFPPLDDPGINDTFDYIEPEVEYDDIGCEKYKDICKELGIVPITRILKSLSGDCLNLKYYGLTMKQMRALAPALQTNTHVKTVILQDNWMSPAAVVLIGQILRDNNTITTLNLRECRIGDEGAEGLIEGLSNTLSLVNLDLSYNSLGDKGLRVLQPSLVENASIKKLNISHNNLTEDSAVTLEAILLGNNAIDDLDLSWNGFFTGPGNKKLCNGLINNQLINHLNLSWNGIGVTKQSMLPIMRYVKQTETLEYLDLSNNRITNESLRMIRAALLVNQSLITVKLGNNIITPEEAMFLATILVVKPAKNHIQHLDLENTYVEKDFKTTMQTKIINANKTIRIGGVLSDYTINGPDINKLLFDRCKYLAMKPKKKKAKKDFGHFILTLPSNDQSPSITKDEFRKLLKKMKVKKLDNDLLNELMGRFPSKGQKVNGDEMQKAYMILYPDTQLPPPKPKKKKKKGKKKKGGKEKKNGTGQETETIKVVDDATIVDQIRTQSNAETTTENMTRSSIIGVNESATRTTDVIEEKIDPKIQEENDIEKV